MTAVRVLLVLVLIALALLQGPRATAAPVEYALGKSFTLGIGESASIRGEDLTVRFTDVPQDSRCATTVVCVWQGVVTTTWVVQHRDGQPTTVNLTGVQAGAGAYTIVTYGVAPYPRTTDPIPLADYRATVSVSKT